LSILSSVYNCPPSKSCDAMKAPKVSLDRGKEHYRKHLETTPIESNFVVPVL